jgi:transglutaminase-like putative cysteine protease/tetratricopeptide (TPR) repeat protein
VGRALVAAVLGLGCALAHGPAQAQSPERDRVSRLAERLAARPRGDEAATLVEAIWGAWDEVGPGPVVEPLTRIAGDPRADRWAREAARWHLAEAALREGRERDARDAVDRLGAVVRYLVIGPLENEGDAGLETSWLPEKAPRDAVPLQEPLEGKGGRQVRWRELTVPDPLGVLRLSGYVSPVEEACAIAVTSIELDRPRAAVISAGAEGALVLWIDGEEVVRDPVYRGLDPARFAVEARLAVGVHRVMAKVCGDDAPPALVLRVTGPRGEPLGGGFSSDPGLAGRAVGPGRPSARTRALETPFGRAWRRATGERAASASARALDLAAAWYLHLTGGDSRSEPLAPDLAAAAAGEPGAGAAPVDVEAQRLAAELAADHNAARRRLEALAARAPRDPLVLSDLAAAAAAGPCPEEALPATARVLELAPDAVRATSIRAALLERQGLPDTALAQVRRALGRLEPAPPLLLAQGAALALGARRPALARSLGAAHAAARHDAVSTHLALAQLARDRGDATAALPRIEALDRVGWHRLPERIEASQLLDQLGDPDAAERLLRRIVAQAPDASEAWASLGRLLAGAGRRDEAVPSLRRSLELQPQDQESRELLARLLEEAPAEDAFVEEPETFLARRGAGQGEHAVVLVDLTVVVVHPSGLSSRFRQIAAEVLDEEGATALRARSIGFVPDEQQVTVRRARVHRADGAIEEASARYVQYLSDPAYRMYYDERAEVVELPRLRAGDVVEIAYRVDDTAARNLFGDFFGDLALFQGVEPRRRVAYVLVHPRGRRIHAEAPALPTLRHEERCLEGGACTLIWEATDVPGLRPEEDQPPIQELAARLALSTYGDWPAVGRWWWGLVRDQLAPDDALRGVVAGLVAGVDDEAGRVRAVYRWVVEHTRYVALEFGIHGYQPYRVTQVVDRGFGDCKDKASLLVAMLGLAGVDASLVLLRTRLSGRVDPRPPSLSVFDHAIAYVPSLDLFLDGTAEQSGTTELPWMDQGAMALVVDHDGGARLVTTPVDPPARNVSSQELRVALPSDASSPPLLVLRETVRGHQAAQLRYAFQSAALRQDRLEARFARSWPGARLLDFRFPELEDRERAVELLASVEAPSVVTERSGRITVELARPRDLTRALARRSERLTPLELGMPPHIEEETRVVELPQGLRPAEVPPDVSIVSPFGSLEMSARAAGREVRVTTRLVIAVDRVEPADYAAFRRFCQSTDRALERRLVVAP